MGKAAVDLPDPMQQPPPAGTTSTDDLLAQLAGEEIDRLLAEADGLPMAPHLAPAGHAPAHAPAPVLETHAPVELPATLPPAARPAATGLVFDEPSPAPAPVAEDLISAPAFEAAPPHTATPRQAQITPEVGEELDALFTAAVAKDLADEADLAARTAAERASLTGQAAPSPSGNAASVAVPAQDPRVPLVLRPLEWINAPLEYVPESVRDVIGKIAIVTLINAAAVIAYVMLFRPR